MPNDPLKTGSDQLPLLFHPTLFKPTFAALKTAMALAGSSRELRNRVQDLIAVCRSRSKALYGHELSFEEAALSALLRGDHGVIDVATEETPLERLYRLGRFGNDERNAAQLVLEVWQVFEKFLGAKTVQLDKGGERGGGERVLPMGRELSDLYRRIYAPWYAAARQRSPVVLGNQRRKVHPLDVTFQLVINRRSLKMLADAYGVSQQDVCDLVRGELLSLASRMEDGDQSGSAGMGRNVSDGTSAGRAGA